MAEAHARESHPPLEPRVRRRPKQSADQPLCAVNDYNECKEREAAGSVQVLTCPHNGLPSWAKGKKLQFRHARQVSGSQSLSSLSEFLSNFFCGHDAASKQQTACPPDHQLSKLSFED